MVLALGGERDVAWLERAVATVKLFAMVRPRLEQLHFGLLDTTPFRLVAFGDAVTKVDHGSTLKEPAIQAGASIIEAHFHQEVGYPRVWAGGSQRLHFVAVRDPFALSQVLLTAARDAFSFFVRPWHVLRSPVATTLVWLVRTLAMGIAAAARSRSCAT